MKKKFSINFFYPILLIGITILAYSNSFQGPFIFDDFVNIINKKSIRLFTPTISGIVQAASEGHSSNRWVPNISFALNYYFGGENVIGYHIVNLLVHLSTAIVLYCLFLATLSAPNVHKAVSARKEIAFFSAVIWAVHPIQTNGVTYLVQRMTSMCTLFFLSSLLLYVLGRTTQHGGKKKYVLYVFSFIFALLSFLSKENAFMLPVMILAYDVFFIQTPDWKKDRKKIITRALVSVGSIIIFAILFLGPDIFTKILEPYALRPFTLSERMLTEARVIFIYLGLLLFPHPSQLNLCHEITLSTSILSPPQTLFSIIGIFLLAALIIFSFNKNRLFSFALFWFLGNLIIESTIVPLEIIFEHRLYLPSTFLILACIYTVHKKFSSKPLFIWTVLLVITVTFCTWTWQRNKTWGSLISLWTDVIEKSPGLARGYNNLGIAYYEINDISKAKELFQRAIIAEPESRIAYISLGASYMGQNRFQEAEQLLRTALTKEPSLNPSRIYHYLGILYRKKGLYEDAMKFSNMALHLEENDIEPMINLGIINEKLGNYQKADDIFTEVMRFGIITVDLYNNWGIAVYKMGQIDRSIQYFKQALAIDPNHPESHYNLGLAYSSKGMKKEAREEMMRSMELRQNSP